MAIVYGVDLGGTSVKLGCFDEKGVLLGKWKIPTDRTENGKNILSDIADTITADRQARGFSPGDVLGIGIGIPGVVKNGVLTEKCVNLGGWGGFDAGARLAEKTGVLVRCVNDANAALLGEQWKGAARGISDVVFFTLGTGVGGAALIGGRLREGHTGSAGEFGHIAVREGESRTCGCGGHGCLEQYASSQGLSWLYRRALSRAGREVPPKKTKIAVRTIFSAAKKGDAAALEAVGEFAKFLGRGLAIVGCAYDPQLFLIGGGLSGAGELLFSRVRAAYRQYAFLRMKDTPIRQAALGNDAGIWGAARLILEPEVLPPVRKKRSRRRKHPEKGNAQSAGTKAIM